MGVSLADLPCVAVVAGDLRHANQWRRRDALA